MTTPYPGILKIDAVPLRHPLLTLDPLDVDRHASELFSVTPPDCFKYFLDWPEQWEEATFAAWLRRSQQRPGGQPFAVIDPATGRAIGCSSLFIVDGPHGGLEIGFTWYAPSARGTHVNPVSKLLLLAHAFDHHHALRVQLKCDARNERSRAAITKLGAKFEGVLRQHRVLPDGFVRDTAYFSITAQEWPDLRTALNRRIHDQTPH